MNKKYIVRLSDKERQELVAVITKLKGTSQKIKRAQILLKADVDGPNWPHYQIAEAFLCRTKTVSNVCKSLLERGFEVALNGKNRDTPPRAKLLDGEQEAKIIALSLGEPPEGYSNWSLRLIAEKAIRNCRINQSHNGEHCAKKDKMTNRNILVERIMNTNVPEQPAYLRLQSHRLAGVKSVPARGVRRLIWL